MPNKIIMQRATSGKDLQRVYRQRANSAAENLFALLSFLCESGRRSLGIFVPASAHCTVGSCARPVARCRTEVASRQSLAGHKICNFSSLQGGGRSSRSVEQTNVLFCYTGEGRGREECLFSPKRVLLTLWVLTLELARALARCREAQATWLLCVFAPREERRRACLYYVLALVNALSNILSCKLQPP